MNLDQIKAHYAKARDSHGETHLGVGWKDKAAQYDRLRALVLLCKDEPYYSYSLNDWGCGYQEAKKFFAANPYRGYDLNDWAKDTIIADAPTHEADYTIASGLFNVKCDAPEEKWKFYVYQCIDVMNRFSRKGFGFNLLPSWVPVRKPELFYLSPYEVMDHCRQYGRVTLLQHYSPFDFAILVHKQ